MREYGGRAVVTFMELRGLEGASLAANGQQAFDMCHLCSFLEYENINIATSSLERHTFLPNGDHSPPPTNPHVALLDPRVHYVVLHMRL